MPASKLGRAGGRSVPGLAYLRVSGRGQIDGDGFPRQRDAVARYARAHGVVLVGEHLDEGVSGTRDLDGREGLGELIERIRANGMRLVLVERADRLARDLLVVRGLARPVPRSRRARRRRRQWGRIAKLRAARLP